MSGGGLAISWILFKNTSLLLVCHTPPVAHVMFKIAAESCIVNFSGRLREPLKKRLTSKGCPLRRALEQSSTTHTARPRTETSLREVADPLNF